MMSNLKIFTKNVEQEAVDQIELLLAQDAFKDCKVRIMPDVHAGKGCVIGFTADLGEKVIPNIVGVDIGCGMLCVSLGQTDIDFEKLEEFEKSMDGIYTTSVNQSTIDESPMAYKTLDEIVENIKDTVDVLAIIKPVYNFKASE
ncbi:MAG: RtcB family protein [Lachnospiraceae bacterium]|nr:RtcB family protein [Lachnospiraceae bacterium]